MADSALPIAVVLLSGGLDSATTLAVAREQGFACHAISFCYGQRHAMELNAAKLIAETLGVTHHSFVSVDLRAFGGSALTDDAIDVPRHAERAVGAGASEEHIPVTYVPARNTIFLSHALGLAEVIGSRDIFIGVNAVDYSGYPDCRPQFIRAFETMANLGTKAGVEGDRFTIHTPLIDLPKAQIIQRGVALGVNYAHTLSCYDPDADGRACGVCDSCALRRKGFEEAGVPDPTRYQRKVAAP